MPSIQHLVILAIVILILFGRGRIAEFMGDFGKGIKSFKQGINDAPPPAPAPAQIAPQPAATPDPAAQPTDTAKH